MLSFAVNLLLMRILVGRMHWPYLAANVAAIAAGSVVNFLLGDLLVFRRGEGQGTAAPRAAGPAKPALLGG
ncbi:MAG: GtrA family protein [Bryobacteraceae bacterium]